MNDSVQKFRHPRERLYAGLMYAAGIIVWPVMFFKAYEVFSNPAFRDWLLKLAPFAGYVVVFVLYLMFRHLFLRAYIYGHYVMVGPEQFPHIGAMVSQAAAEVGLKRVPVTFIRNSGGVMNAMAVRLFGRRYVWLNSALIDADDDAQLRFIVGHEIGHHAFGHLDRWRNFLKFPGKFVPLLGAAYSRSRELSCDRIGAYLAHDLAASLGALQMLACGSARLNARMNPAAFQQQEQMVPPVTGFLLHVFSGYPRLTRRVEAVNLYFAEFVGRGDWTERGQPEPRSSAAGLLAES